MKRLPIYCLLLFGVFRLSSAYAVGDETLPARSVDTMVILRYERAYDEMVAMLDGRQSLSVKRAVFLAEWAYLDGALDYADYCRTIDSAALFLQQFIETNGLDRYKTGRNLALTEYFFNPYSGNGYKPFVYDFGETADDEDFTRQFVTPLMRTHKGQCRSLPMYYRILAEAIGAEACIAYAPAHVFIRYRNDDGLYPEEWVNVELTTHQITPEFWYKEQFEIGDRQIQTRVYLHPLTDRETVAAQLADLAVGYRKKFGYYDAFTLQCADRSAQYYPQNPKAAIIRGNSLDVLRQELLAGNRERTFDEVRKLEEELHAISLRLDSLGWRPMGGELFEKLEQGNEDGRRKTEQCIGQR